MTETKNQNNPAIDALEEIERKYARIMLPPPDWTKLTPEQLQWIREAWYGASLIARHALQASAIARATIQDRAATNELVPFKLIDMPCCHHQICWINPRLPTYCPECGTNVYMLLKTGQHFLAEADAWLRIEGYKARR